MTTKADRAHKNIYSGQVIAIKKHNVVINTFLKCLYYIDINDFTEEELKSLLGSTIRVYIMSLDNCKNKDKIAYYKKAKYEILWSKIMAYKAKNQLIEGSILNTTKGGYTVQISIDNISINAFMPMSHTPSSEELVPGHVNTFKIIGTNKIHKNIVISRKEVLLSEMAVKNEANAGSLCVGQTIYGIVKNISQQGMSVGTGISGDYSFYVPAYLATYRHELISTLFAQGQTLSAQIKEIIEPDKKVILSMVDLNNNPFTKYQDESTIDLFPLKIIHEYNENYIIIGKTQDQLLCKITKSNNTLPLTAITEAIENKTSIEARVLLVNSDNRCILCTTFKSPKEVWDEFIEEYNANPNQIFEFTAKNKSKFMLFANYKKINAVIPINLIHYKNTIEEFGKIKAGDTIRATIININEDHQEILCSAKAAYREEADAIFDQLTAKTSVMCKTQYVFTNTKRVVCIEGQMDVVLNTNKMSPKKLKLMDDGQETEMLIKAHDKNLLHIELVSSATDLAGHSSGNTGENLLEAMNQALSVIKNIEE